MLVGGGANKKGLKISNEVDLNLFMLIIVTDPLEIKLKSKET